MMTLGRHLHWDGICNPVWTFLFTGERPGPWALVGGAVILAVTAWRTVQPVLVARRART